MRHAFALAAVTLLAGCGNSAREIVGSWHVVFFRGEAGTEGADEVFAQLRAQFQSDGTFEATYQRGGAVNGVIGRWTPGAADDKGQSTFLLHVGMIDGRTVSKADHGDPPSAYVSDDGTLWLPGNIDAASGKLQSVPSFPMQRDLMPPAPVNGALMLLGMGLFLLTQGLWNFSRWRWTTPLLFGLALVSLGVFFLWLPQMQGLAARRNRLDWVQGAPLVLAIVIGLVGGVVGWIRGLRRRTAGRRSGQKAGQKAQT